MAKRPLPPEFEKFMDPMPGIANISEQSRLSLNLPSSLHHSLTEIATRHGMSLQRAFESLVQQVLTHAIRVEDLAPTVPPPESSVMRRYTVTLDLDASLQDFATHAKSDKAIVAVRLLQMAIDRNLIPQ